MTKKKERIYREILAGVERGTGRFKQSELSVACNVSIGHVNKTIALLERINVIEKHGIGGFSVINPKKLMVYWASQRNLQKDVIYRARVNNKPVEEIEAELPSSVLFTAYSGYKFRFGDAPADYSEVIVYSSSTGGEEEIRRRIRERFAPGLLSERGKIPNLIVLRADDHLRGFSPIVPVGQLFVDLWNLNTWYAQEFLRALEVKFDAAGAILERPNH